MVHSTVKPIMRLVVLLAGLSWIASACGSDSGCAKGLRRAPSGDAVCVGMAECSLTSGQPDHQGCPNTCSCLCSFGQCFESTCTAIGGCTAPPTYR